MNEFEALKSKASEGIQKLILLASKSASSQKIAYFKKFYSEAFTNFEKSIEKEVIKQEKAADSLF